VAYATKYGATAEIAEKIGQVLRQAGLRTDVLPTDRVSDLSPYKAVVLGSAVYIGRWRKEAATFLKANEKALAERPVRLFSSGPTGEGEPVELTKGWRFPKTQASHLTQKEKSQ
jgi:menaquinone-dependent protoporphyrinogen oxidase